MDGSVIAAPLLWYNTVSGVRAKHMHDHINIYINIYLHTHSQKCSPDRASVESAPQHVVLWLSPRQRRKKEEGQQTARVKSARETEITVTVAASPPYNDDQ